MSLQFNDFLVEIGTEELPPKSLKTLIKSFRDNLLHNLRTGYLACDDQNVLVFASPRRLSVLIPRVASQVTGVSEHIFGPPTAIAFDVNNKPTPVAEAFAKKMGVSVDQLDRKLDDSGKKPVEKLFFKKPSADTYAKDILPGAVDFALRGLPIPKRMRWGARKAEFVRPVHWVLMMYGNEVIDCEILEQRAGNKTRGHRYHSPDFFTITSPATYQKQLREHFVEVCFKLRRNKITEQVNAVAQKLGGKAVIERDLLDEVTALVEWPVALAGNFEKRFLDVPQEALISSMSEHQKYFHVVDAKGKLMPYFITVANLESKDPQQVIDGNERVIRPRLTDAAFFFETDKKHTLESRLEKLKTVTFQDKLGSVYDKSVRVSKLAEHIAQQIGADVKAAGRAGLLCKADLVSKMVLEFDKMQGIAGQYYALNDGETPLVANAIREHYLPKFAGDEVPHSLEGCAVALADRIDTLVGIFSIGEKPTGSKDPFALRRAAIGILHIILKRRLEVDLVGLVTNEDALSYVMDRFQSMYEEENIPLEVFKSVALSKHLITSPLDFDIRVRAVNAFNALPEAQSLAAANKRVSNILSKSTAATNPVIDISIFQQDEERTLWKLIEEKRASVLSNVETRQFEVALCSLAVLKTPVDAFFAKVMVNIDDEKIRNNRLNLLNDLRNLFLSIADISYLVPEKK